MSKVQTIDANTDIACACCGRYHRKLYLVDGHWMGRNCADDYKYFRFNDSLTHWSMCSGGAK